MGAVLAPSNCKPDLSCRTIFKNIIVHLITGGFTAFLTYLSFVNGITLFSWHAPLMSFGYFILMTEAILCFNNQNALTSNLSHKNKITLHWILQTVAVILVAIGYTAIFVNKSLHNKPHFHSYHAIFGTTAVVTLALTIGGGITAKYNLILKGYVKPVYVKIGHSIGGLASYALGLFTIILGLYTHWFHRNSTTWSIYVCLIVILYVMLTVVLKPIVCLYTRLKGVY